MQQQQLYLQHYLYSSSNIRNVTQCSSSNYTYSITYIAAVTSAMLLNAAAAVILIALYLYSSSNIRNVTQCSSSSYTYSITYIAAV